MTRILNIDRTGRFPARRSTFAGLILIAFLITVAGPQSAARPNLTEQLPGAAAFDEALLKKLARMREFRGQNYQPRTRHLQPDGRARYTNRLFLESSPYLIQHAHNPVNWYPWGDEAFDTARKLNRPVLLSVGYSTCHWCHVMEEESYEDEEIARFLNRNFIAIKVDREERPDIDAIYMAAVQAITGRGGWPLNVWLTADRQPFYGGTYFPARDGDRGIGMGFLTVLQRISVAYHQEPSHAVEIGQTLTAHIRKRLHSPPGEGLPTVDLMAQVVSAYKQSFDPVNGGLQGAPKFPSSLPIRLLLRYQRRATDPKVLQMAAQTLTRMAAGGIYDQVGGGFHRYATDPQWRIPHFEKMLYDNALLVLTYLEGYQVTGDEGYKRVVVEVLNYIEREMTSPQGAFYSATDADSLTPQGHREEGYYFTWTGEELEQALGQARAAAVKAYYGVTSEPNFEGRHILYRSRPATQVAAELSLTTEKLLAIIAESNSLLYDLRNRKPRPLRDEKILSAWNGLMISAHARAGLLLDEPRYTARAVKAAEFILQNLLLGKQLYRNYHDSRAGYTAYLDDYAFLGAGFLDLFEATGDLLWLNRAVKLDQTLADAFEDKKAGGFFMTPATHETLIARQKPNFDGAEPSGNSVAILNLLRLAEFTFEDSYRIRAEKALQAFLGGSAANPLALSEMMLALDYYFDSPLEIVIVTPAKEPHGAAPFLARFRERFLPNRILVVATEGKDQRNLARRIPVVKGKSAIKGKTTAYVCEKGSCKLPTQDPDQFAQQLEVIKPLPGTAP